MLKLYYSCSKDEGKKAEEIATVVVDADKVERKDIILPNVSQKETRKDINVCD